MPSAARTRSSARTTSSSTPASIRWTPSCAAPAGFRRGAAPEDGRRTERDVPPDEACDVLEATALWWQIQLDPEDRTLDNAFTASVERAIRTSEAWTERRPNDPEAWFYLGGAYAARVQWRVLRNEKISAARDGKRIKQALEQALELDPALDDAYFALGMYKYLRRRGADRRKDPAVPAAASPAAIARKA